MATLKDIKNRIRAVGNTQQITKAMKMVSAAKLRRAQGRMLELRPYAQKMRDVIASLASGSDLETHPLLASRPVVKNVEVLVLTSDRGLCGAFNTNILRMAQRKVADLKAQERAPEKVMLSTVGKKAKEYFKRRDVEIANSWTGLSGSVTYQAAQEVAKALMAKYISGEVDEVYLAYNFFVNVGRQETRVIKLLPTTPDEEPAAKTEARADFIYEPDEEKLLEALVPKGVEIQVYHALLESVASEEAARMTAMENATKAASEMISALTLEYNKARQASITGELMDIVGGVEALKD